MSRRSTPQGFQSPPTVPTAAQAAVADQARQLPMPAMAAQADCTARAAGEEALLWALIRDQAEMVPLESLW